jgi:outer membrane lipoprotein-sorting protein
MRRITVFLAIAVIAISSVSAQDLSKILNDHYKASAQDKMSKITSATIKGNISAMGMEMGLTLYQARPGKLRVEADLAGSKVIQTYNGTTGWTYAPAMGILQPQQLGAEELKSIVKQADMDSPLWDYKAKGNKVELLGSSDDGSAYKIKVTAAEGDQMTIFINKETSLISKMVSTQFANGMDMEIETEVKDYKNVKGIPVAHYLATKMGGQVVSTITFESVEYDQNLDASLFEKPVIE